MGRLVENTSIKKRDPKHKVYCQEDYAQEAYDRYCDFSGGRKLVAKDMAVGQICSATVMFMDANRVILQAESTQSIMLDYQRESNFLEKKGLGTLTPGTRLEVMIESAKLGEYVGSIEKAYILGIKKDLFKAMRDKNAAYEVTVKSVNDGGFIVDLSGVDCFMPGSLAAANKILDFNSMLNKKLYVMVETYLDQSDMFVVSNKKYIQHILPQKIRELNLSKEYSGTITGVMPYGCFVEWDEIFTGLLHETEMNDPNWKEMKSGSFVTFWVKEIKENNRIILSARGPSVENKLWQEFKEKYEGKTFPDAIIKDVKPFGVFIDMKGVVGMLTPREFKRTGVKPTEGEFLDVFVKQVDVYARKVFLKNRSDDVE